MRKPQIEKRRKRYAPKQCVSDYGMHKDARHGKAEQGAARQGRAGHGKARPGAARQGEAEQGACGGKGRHNDVAV